MMITVNIQSTSVICTCSQSVIVQGHFGLWKQVATCLHLLDLYKICDTPEINIKKKQEEVENLKI